MPALKNPRHEAFAQAIFNGIINGKGACSQAEAYRRAGYRVTNGNSAKACASRLLTLANHIGDRVKELQAIAAADLKEDATKLTAELNTVLQEARAEKAYGPAVSAIMGKAKVLGIIDKPQAQSVDWNTTTSMKDIGAKLLQSVGFASPDDVSIQAAIVANDAFIARLEAIRDSAQTLTIE
jgi:hypothetical protein